jgi:hypothetical protein
VKKQLRWTGKVKWLLRELCYLDIEGYSTRQSKLNEDHNVVFGAVLRHFPNLRWSQPKRRAASI